MQTFGDGIVAILTAPSISVMVAGAARRALDSGTFLAAAMP
jgi:hypothetical protein